MTTIDTAPETITDEPLISVIVPVYNVERWLDKCLSSICSQTYRKLQIVCVDDGSTDGSARILAEWTARDDRICVVTKKNGGLSSARNAGLEVARGEFVTGVDSDDWLFPDIYEKAVRHLSDDCDMLVFRAQSVNEDGGIYRDGEKAHFHLPEEGLYEMDWIRNNRLNPCFWNKLWRRSVITENGLRFPDGLVFEDEVFIRLFTSYARNFYSLPEMGYAYVQRRGSIMHERRTLSQIVSIYMADVAWMWKFCEEHKSPDVAWNNALDFLASSLPLHWVDAVKQETYKIVSGMYADFIAANRIADRFPNDYRLEFLSHIPYRNNKIFISRTASSKTYKLFGFPLLKILYKHGKYHSFKTFLSIFKMDKVRKMKFHESN